MNKTELAKVFTKVQLVDNRQAGQLVLAEWLDILGHLNFDECISAVVMHRQESVEYLQPAHIIANVKRIREERALRTPSIDHNEIAYPRPINDDAMSAAWNNPAEFRRQQVIYNEQLAREGFDPLPLDQRAA